MVLAQPATGAAWAPADSAALYGLERWGDPYFSVNSRGHVIVQPRGDRGGALDLVELVQGLQGRNLSLPLLIRFDDILEDRLERLHAAFERASPVAAGLHDHVAAGIEREIGFTPALKAIEGGAVGDGPAGG